MYIYTNEAKLKKYKNISKWTTIASFAVLIAGAVAAFSPKYITLSFIALIVGFIMSQISISLTSKWGREPSNNNIFNVKLKGLSDNFSIYHYMDPVDHLLVGTAGTFILMPYFQGGEIGYDETKERWTQKKANFFMKLFGQENIGRPDQECAANLQAVRDYFISREIDFPEDKIHPVLVFINPQAVIQEGQNFKYDTIPLGQLKKTIANYAKADRLDPAFIDEVTDKLPLDDIE
jgi:hypothetical protein